MLEEQGIKSRDRSSPAREVEDEDKTPRTTMRRMGRRRMCRTRRGGGEDNYGGKYAHEKNEEKCEAGRRRKLNTEDENK
jgi:hypothetical protein